MLRIFHVIESINHFNVLRALLLQLFLPMYDTRVSAPEKNACNTRKKDLVSSASVLVPPRRLMTQRQRVR